MESPQHRLREELARLLQQIRYLFAFFFRNSLVLMAPGANTSGRSISAFQSLGRGAVLRHPRNLERNIAGGTELDGCTQSHELVFLQSAYDKSLTLTAIVPHRHSGIYSVGQSQMVSEICVINGEQTVRNDYSVIQTLEPRCIHPDNFTVYDAAMGIDSKGHELWNDLNFVF